MGTENCNLAAHIRQRALEHPERKAMIWARGKEWQHLTYREFEARTDAYAYGFREAGMGRGVHTILLVKPDIRFFLVLASLLKTGAVPIVIDAGMGVGNMMRCLASTGAEAFVGITAAQALRGLYKKKFSSIRTHVTVGPKPFRGGWSFDGLYQPREEPFPIADPGPGELATIFFTTGSTGPAKGVEITARAWLAQIERLKMFMDPGQPETDLATFPIFAFYDLVAGNTAVLPDMDPTRPARVDPRKIIKAVEDHGVTNMFGSPALLDRVGRYARPRGLTFPGVKRVLSGGAPVPASIMETFSGLLDGAEVVSVYGATECLPIAYMGSDEVLSEISRPEHLPHGTCVGRPVPGLELEVIRITDDPIAEFSGGLLSGKGEVGEIMIKCAHMSTAYHKRPEADAAHKVRQGSETWHRTGDLGWVDEQGRLWFCGRKQHRVETAEGTFFSVPCENVFNSHPGVKRSALVGVDAGTGMEPVICIEPERGVRPDARLVEELLETAAAYDITRPIRRIEFFKAFPVDIRHNAKIFREKLAGECSSRLS